jgi:signal peptidase I
LVKKTFQISGIVLLTLMFLLTAVTALGAALKDERQLSPWGTGFFFITSGSMEPAMPVGTLAFVVAVSAEKIIEEDVITFFSANGRSIVTHRVKAITGSEGNYVFTTRGDANNVDDPPFGYDRVIGKVMFSLTGLSPFSGFFKNTSIMGITVIGIGIILFLLSLKKSE